MKVYQFIWQLSNRIAASENWVWHLFTDWRNLSVGTCKKQTFCQEFCSEKFPINNWCRQGQMGRKLNVSFYKMFANNQCRLGMCRVKTEPICRYENCPCLALTAVMRSMICVCSVSILRSVWSKHSLCEIFMIWHVCAHAQRSLNMQFAYAPKRGLFYDMSQIQ